MDKQEQRQALQDQLELISQYKSTEYHVNFIKLLHLLDKEYDDDLREATKENLGIKQGASKQLRLLASSLMNYRKGDVPKI